MSTNFDPQIGLAQFKLPPQDIDVLSFCRSAKVSKLKEWAESLKITQINQTAVTLYSAVPELSHLKTDSSNRYTMLELVWPIAQQNLQVFSKEYLQQPLMLPPKAQKSAIISQAIQKHLLDGYCLCAADLVQQKKLKPHKQELLLNCLYRAMEALSRLMLRSYQLYSPIPARMWLRAHALLQTAEAYDIHDEIAPASTQRGEPSRTIIQIYLKIAAMGCIHPNQLSQSDLDSTLRALDQWSKHISLVPTNQNDDKNLFIVNLSKDIGPHEKIRGHDSAEDLVLEIDFQALVSLLNSQSSSSSAENSVQVAGKLSIPPHMPATLIQHVLDCWCHCSKRKQTRKSIQIKAEACIGIIDCHYHISGKVAFNQFMAPVDNDEGEDEDDSFLSTNFDELISNLSHNDERNLPAEEKDNIFNISIQNLSAGGYCLHWQDKLPSRIEAGELIGIREAGRRSWSIGTVRWIRQMKKTSQMGVQLLCNQPIPYGASVMLDNGIESDYMRVIHIPAPTMSDQPPSLLTTAIPFQEGRRAELKQDDHTTAVRLGKSVFSTGKLKLFGFETINQGNEEPHNY